MDIGQLGAWMTYNRIGEERAREAARLVEELGYGAFWLGGSPRLAELRPLLDATERIVVATSIVNVWAYDAAELGREYAELERDFPGRVLVGIGIGHPEATSEYARPFTAMQRFLDVLDRPESHVPTERRVLAALAPKMIDLSAERALGAIPYFVPIEHTRRTREQLGPGPLLAPELTFVLDEDRDAARAKARAFAAFYLGLGNYCNTLFRHGFDEDDVADGGSDRLLDAVVPQGNADEIVAMVRAHLDAGADHVAVQAVGGSGIPREEWTAVARRFTR